MANHAGDSGNSQTSLSTLTMTLVILVAAAIFFIVGIELHWTWLISGKTPYDVIVDLGILTAAIAVLNGLVTIQQSWKVDRFKTRLHELMASPLAEQTKTQLAHSDTLTTFQGLFQRARNNAADYLEQAGFATATRDEVERTTAKPAPPLPFITVNELNILRQKHQ